MDRAGKTYAMKNGLVVVFVLSSTYVGRDTLWWHKALTLACASTRYDGTVGTMVEHNRWDFETIYEEIGSLPR